MDGFSRQEIAGSSSADPSAAPCSPFFPFPAELGIHGLSPRLGKPGNGGRARKGGAVPRKLGHPGGIHTPQGLTWSQCFQTCQESSSHPCFYSQILDVKLFRATPQLWDGFCFLGKLDTRGVPAFPSIPEAGKGVVERDSGAGEGILLGSCSLLLGGARLHGASGLMLVLAFLMEFCLLRRSRLAWYFSCWSRNTGTGKILQGEGEGAGVPAWIPHGMGEQLQ